MFQYKIFLNQSYGHKKNQFIQNLDLKSISTNIFFIKSTKKKKLPPGSNIFVSVVIYNKGHIKKGNEQAHHQQYVFINLYIHIYI